MALTEVAVPTTAQDFTGDILDETSVEPDILCLNPTRAQTQRCHNVTLKTR